MSQLDPKILQAGAAKSGNYWFYTILGEICKSAGIPDKSFIQNQPIYSIAKDWQLSFPGQSGVDVVDIQKNGLFFRISNIYKEAIQDPQAYIDQTRRVWTHSKYNKKSDDVFPLFDKIIYIVRDPRDVLLSMANFILTDYMKNNYQINISSQSEYISNRIQPFIKNWVTHVVGYLKAQRNYNIYFVFYERLLSDFHSELEHMLDYLELNISNDEKERIKKTVSFETMKKESSQHVSQGDKYKWKNILTKDQNKIVVGIAGPLLNFFNYPLYFNDVTSNQLPAMKSSYDYDDLDKLYKTLETKTLKDRLHHLKKALL